MHRGAARVLGRVDEGTRAATRRLAAAQVLIWSGLI
jgi:hypothetical protein